MKTAIKLVVLAVMLANIHPAFAWDKHTIESINGDYITLDDGRVFEGNGSSNWNDGDQVIVNSSGDKMINQTQGGDPIDVDESD